MQSRYVGLTQSRPNAFGSNMEFIGCGVPVLLYIMLNPVLNEGDKP